jgi:hypothetical protein
MTALEDLPAHTADYIRGLRRENRDLRLRSAEVRAENAELRLQVVTQQMDIADLREGIKPVGAR